MLNVNKDSLFEGWKVNAHFAGGGEVSVYKVVIYVCLLRCPVITYALDRFDSKLDLNSGDSRECY